MALKSGRKRRRSRTETHRGHLTDVISTLDVMAQPALYKVDFLFLPPAA